MTKTKSNEMVRAALAEIQANLEQEAEEFDRKVDAKNHGRGEFNIDTIEELMGKAMKMNNDATVRLFAQMTSATEAEAIKKKRAELKAAGIKTRNGGEHEAGIQTLFGLLPIMRTVLKKRMPGGKRRCANQFCKRLAEIKPLDEFLQTDKLPMRLTKAMMARCAKFGQLMPYAQAEKIFREDMGHQICDDTIRTATDIVGKKVQEEDQRSGEETWKNMPYLDWKRDRKGVFYIMIDGSMLNTWAQGEDGSCYHEVKLALMFAGEDALLRSDGKTIRITKKDFAVYMGDKNAFKKYVFDTAVKARCFEYEKIVIISDGAPWIRNMCEELFVPEVRKNEGEVVFILDFYHVAEHVFDFAKARFNHDAAQYTPWAEAVVHLLKESRTEEARGKIEQEAKGHTGAELPDLLGYLENNKDRMDYAGYKRDGLYIGSGPIESSNKTVVQKRCKQAGMKWSIPCVQRLLSLRSKWESGVWNSAVHDYFLAAA